MKNVAMKFHSFATVLPAFEFKAVSKRTFTLKSSADRLGVSERRAEEGEGEKTSRQQAALLLLLLILPPAPPAPAPAPVPLRGFPFSILSTGRCCPPASFPPSPFLLSSFPLSSFPPSFPRFPSSIPPPPPPPLSISISPPMLLALGSELGARTHLSHGQRAVLRVLLTLKP